MRLMLAAERAELFQLNAFGGGFFVFGLGIVAVFAFAALKSDDFAHKLFP